MFSKSLDIFSGSEYRAQLVLRNHMQTDKYSNLVSVAETERERERGDYLLTLQIISDCPKRLEVHKSAAAARCGCVQLSPGGQR